MKNIRIRFGTMALPLAVLTGTFLQSCEDHSALHEQNHEAALLAEHMRYDGQVEAKAKKIFKPIGEVAENPDNPITEQKVKLGKILYFDKRLSKDGNISCNSCHNLKTGGVDNLPTSPGDDGTLGDRNSPTVLNAAFHTSQFWDGRAKDVEEQAGMPITNPVEMAIPSKDFLVDRLSGIDMYKQLFAEAFPSASKPLTYDNIQNAIGAFERTLVTPSRFDEYLKGESQALTIAEKRGLKTFMDAGCITCHTGATLGGNMFQKFGLYKDYWDYTLSEHIDEGRFKETKKEADRFIFKVPSLRNIHVTAPYFHDGSVAALEEAVKIMGEVNLNKRLTEEEVSDIMTFLDALTGELPEGVAEEPKELAGI